MVHTGHTYTVHARECVCNYSGFSKRIPRLEHPRVGLRITSVHRTGIPG